MQLNVMQNTGIHMALVTNFTPIGLEREMSPDWHFRVRQKNVKKIIQINYKDSCKRIDGIKNG